MGIKDILLQMMPHLQYREESEIHSLRDAIHEEFPETDTETETPKSETESETETAKTGARRTSAGVKKADGSPHGSA
jgi:hypothetical protein